MTLIYCVRAAGPPYHGGIREQYRVMLVNARWTLKLNIPNMSVERHIKIGSALLHANVHRLQGALHDAIHTNTEGEH